jgi:hypothetical protein
LREVYISIGTDCSRITGTLPHDILTGEKGL